jgi:hypothetical protein
VNALYSGDVHSDALQDSRCGIAHGINNRTAAAEANEILAECLQQRPFSRPDATTAEKYRTQLGPVAQV